MGGLLGGGGSSKPATLQELASKAGVASTLPDPGSVPVRTAVPAHLGGGVVPNQTNFPNQQQMTADQLAFGGYGSSPDILAQLKEKLGGTAGAAGGTTTFAPPAPPPAAVAPASAPASRGFGPNVRMVKTTFGTIPMDISKPGGGIYKSLKEMENAAIARARGK